MAAALSVNELRRHLAEAMGADGVTVGLDQPLSSQLAADSVRMGELAIVPEQELGLDLPGDFDLRQATVADRDDQYTGLPRA